ncbi:MAG: alpha/beta hydrolase family protein [Promethearchaeota archaeon]
MKRREKLAESIENLKSRIEKKLLFRYLGIIFLSLSLILTVISVSLAVVLRAQQRTYFSDENIDVQSISIQMRDGIIINGLVYVDKISKKNTNHSIPTILLLHGINGRKEHKIRTIYQYVKFGYAVVSVEQRGHGESGSPSGFLSIEPYDMIEVIDYIQANYQYANTSHLGLLGYSYGGGVGASLQALEDRIHAAVLYHPLADLESLLGRIPLRYLIGSNIVVENLDEIQDGFEISNENNTQNLLLLQGEVDNVILLSDTERFYGKINPANRTDILLKTRPGLGHGSNEEDLTSLKMAITWFEHYYHNQTINTTNLENEINMISLFNYNYPTNTVSEDLIITSAIFLFIGLSLLVVKFRIKPFWDRLPIKEDVDNSREGKDKYKRMIVYRTSGYMGALLITGIIFSLFNQSILYGYFIFFPIISIIIMLFIPSELHSNWKHEWKNWVNNDLIPFLYTLSIVIIPAIYFLLLYNLVTGLTLSFTIPIFNISSVPYLVLGLGSGIMDYLYLREMKGRHAMILMIIRPITILIFLAFVPLPPFPILGGVFPHVLFILLTGVILYYIRSLVMLLAKFYKNSSSLYLLIMLPFVIFYIRVFFRII